MWIVQPRTQGRATNSGKPQVKIRLESLGELEKAVETL